MKNFQSVLFGATLAATTAAVAFSPSSAQAISLDAGGLVTIEGNSSVVGSLGNSQIAVNFERVNTVTPTGVFLNIIPGLTTGVPGNLPIGGVSGIIIQNLTLNRVGDSAFNYETGSVVPFLNFGTRTLDGTTAELTFDLNPAQFVAQAFTGGGVALSLLGTTGTWKFGDQIVGTAAISATDLGAAGSYTITATAVPEPLTMGGLALGAGFGAFLKTRYSKKDEQLEKV